MDYRDKYNNNEKIWNILIANCFGKSYYQNVTDTKWTNTIGKTGANRLAQCSSATNLQFVKNATSAMNKTKHNKTA